MPYNASDENQVKDKQQKYKNERDQQLEDIKDILASKAGMRFFSRLFSEGKVFQTTFTGDSQTFFLEGHRNLALMFFADVCEACPEKIARLMLQKEEERK